MLHLQRPIYSSHYLSAKEGCSNSSLRQIRTRLRICDLQIFVCRLNSLILLILNISEYEVFICHKRTVINCCVSHVFALCFHRLAKICQSANQCNLSFILKLAFSSEHEMPIYKYTWFKVSFPEGLGTFRAQRCVRACMRIKNFDSA